MTPLETELLQRLGTSYLHEVEALSIFVFFYGVFVVLFSASTLIFVRRGFSTRATTVMFIVTAINFLLSSLSTGYQISGFIVFIRKALILDIEYPLSEKPESVKSALQNFNMVDFRSGPILLSDLVVVWRAWALFTDRRSVVLIPFVLWIGAVGLTVGDTIWLSTHHGYDYFTSNKSGVVMILSLVLSIATNAVTTMMIAYKLWSFRRFVVRTLGSGRRMSLVQTVLILLIESGLVFLVLQTVYLFFSVYKPPGDPFSFQAYGFNALYFSLAPMYPTIVIVLVETQRSMAEITGLPNTTTQPHLSSVGSIDSEMDNETESLPPYYMLQSQDVQGCSLEETMLEINSNVKESRISTSR